MKDALALTRLRPDRLLGQVLIIIFGAVLLYQFAVVILFREFDVEGRRQYVSEADFVTGVFISLNGVAVSRRRDQADEIISAAPYVQIIFMDSPPEHAPYVDSVFKAEIDRINRHLRGDLSAFPARWRTGDGALGIATQLSGGAYCLLSIDQDKKPANLIWRWITDQEPAIPLVLTRLPRALLLYLISIFVILFWVAREVVSPIIKLSREVKSVSVDGDYSLSIQERGSEEIRDLTRSINEMHRKIFDMALHRRYALVGLSHDLKTMLTRLILRVEFIKDEEIRNKFRQDFGVMRSMVEKNLDFLRAEGTSADYVVVDMGSLIDTVIDQFQGLDAKITFSGAAGVVVENSVSDLFRILTNVISNAVRYSDNVTIMVLSTDDEVSIEVADDGPGIPDELKDAVFEPFVRGSPEQTLGEDGGFGLGLAIVKTLLDRQGGKISLIDNSPKGLVVRMALSRHGLKRKPAVYKNSLCN